MSIRAKLEAVRGGAKTSKFSKKDSPVLLHEPSTKPLEIVEVEEIVKEKVVKPKKEKVIKPKQDKEIKTPKK
jgi:hypothetical protein